MDICHEGGVLVRCHDLKARQTWIQSTINHLRLTYCLASLARHAKGVFDSGDLAAQRRLGQPKRAGGCGQGPFFGRYKKRPRAVPIQIYRTPVHALQRWNPGAIVNLFRHTKKAPAIPGPLASW